MTAGPMLAMAALLPTNTPAPMIPPMEIITKWRASRDLERRDEADSAAAFNGRHSGWSRTPRTLRLCPAKEKGACRPLFSSTRPALELEGRAEIEGAADLGLEQRVFAGTIDEQRV